ncbi:MAG: glycosyltransferase family 2 protein [Candidatus Kapaibacterium sp.]
MDKKISVIVPVYGGENTIEKLAARVFDFFNEKNITGEIVFVHDCGKDNSWEIIEKIKNDNPERVTAIQLTRNFGQHNAIICGFGHASGEFFVTMDEDLQQDPFDIDLLLKEQARGDFDVVYGKFRESNHSLFRKLTSSALKALLRAGLPGLHRDYSPLRLIKREIALLTRDMNNSYTFLDGYLTWVTNSVSSIEVSHSRRLAGKSSYNLARLINHTLNIFFTFSDLPIRILTYLSVIIFALSGLYSLITLIRKFFLNDLIEGWASLIIVTGFGTGLIMLGLGITGEYIHRINLKSTKRPNYIERKNI